MNKTIFSRFNRRMILLLSAMLIIFISTGLFQIIAMYTLYGEIRTYEQAAKSAKEIQIIFQKQGEISKEIMQAGGRENKYRDYFYTLSKYSDQVQNSIYNLKILFANDDSISAEINKLIASHNKLTKRSVSLIFELQERRGNNNTQAILTIENETTAILSDIENIVKIIEAGSEENISVRQRSFSIITSVSFTAAILLFVFLILYLVRTNRKAQTGVIDLARVLNSYLPPQFVSSVTENKNNELPALSRKYLTVCFTDLAGFTAAAEGCEPEMIAHILDEYLSEMAVIAQSWGGMVDKFMGDGIMIIFGAFDNDPDAHATNSIRMAIAMQKKMATLIEEWRTNGFVASLGLRIGINTGYATIGSIGPDDRRSYTAIGSTINIASRMEKLCTTGRIMITHDTKIKVREKYDFIPCENRTIKGINRSIQIYEIIP